MNHRLTYGTDPFQFGDLLLPEGAGPNPVAIVVHGGFWRSTYGLDYITPFCEALTASGIATWNLEYRRIGNDGGGWPGTLDDIAAGADYVDLIAARFNLDLSQVIAIGHSAGGHLAMWLASRKRLLSGAISLAGVVDLRRAWELHLSNTVVADFLGGDPEEFPERYDQASPIEQLPFGIPQRLFHGTADASVPFEISERYVHTAQLRGDDAELITLENTGHFEMVDPGTKEFASVRQAALTLTNARAKTRHPI